MDAKFDRPAPQTARLCSRREDEELSDKHVRSVVGSILRDSVTTGPDVARAVRAVVRQDHDPTAFYGKC